MFAVGLPIITWTQEVVNNLEIWDQGLRLEHKVNGQKDTMLLRDMLIGKDRISFLIDQYGDTLNYESMENKLILLDFWHLRCQPCIAEITGFDVLTNRFDRKRFKVLALTPDDQEELDKKLLSKRAFQFSIISNARLIDKPVYPLKILLDKNGEVRHVKNYGSIAENAHLRMVEEFTPFIKRWIYR